MANPGTYDRKVSFRAVTITKSGMGAPVKIYSHSFFMWMSREQPLTDQEQYINNRLVVPTRYTYRGHNNSAINETMQLVDANVKYNILSINPVQMNMFIEILVEKITE
jgi:hypothetical protein